MKILADRMVGVNKLKQLRAVQHGHTNCLFYSNSKLPFMRRHHSIKIEDMASMEDHQGKLQFIIN